MKTPKCLFNKITCICYLIFASIGTSCENPNKYQFNCENREITNKTEIVMVIPEVGCGTCIASGLQFLKTNQSTFQRNIDRYTVVLSSIHSMKMVKRSLEKYKINADSLNLVFDIDNRYQLYGKHKFYPTVFYLNCKKVVKVESQSPDNKFTLKNLEKYINS